MAFFTTGCLAVCLEGAVFAARPARLVTACQKKNTLELYSTDQGFMSDVPLFRGHVNFPEREEVSESDRLEYKISSFVFLFQDCSFVLSRIENQNFPSVPVRCATCGCAVFFLGFLFRPFLSLVHYHYLIPDWL